MVAHFDYYYNKGDTITGQRGVVLIPRTISSIASDLKMNDTETTEGGYTGSLMNTVTLPAVASALSTVFGSYLLSNNMILTTEVDDNIQSMGGGGWYGASKTFAWTSSQCVLPSEVQIFGASICSSSMYDTGEANEKLAVFNFINHVEYGRYDFWLRSIVAARKFGRANYSGISSYAKANSYCALRPLIYIG